MLTTKQYTNLLADAYYAAALANADMQQTTSVLEALRAVMTKKPDYFPAWDALDEQVGKAEEKRLQTVVIKLRTQFEQQVCHTEIARLLKIFRGDPESGWKDWLSTYSHAFVNSRLLLCMALSAATLPFPEQYWPQVAHLQQAEQYFNQGRYVEAYDTYLYFAGQACLSPVERGKLLVYAAVIQLLHLNKLKATEKLLQQAAELAFQDSTLSNGWGLYWLQQNNFEKAWEAFQEGIKQDAELVDNYLAMGDSYDRLNNLDEAGHWYSQAITVNAGNPWAYIRLLRLYSRKELFPTHEPQLKGLLEHANRVNPLGTYVNALELGYAYQQNKRYKQANAWYSKAIEINDTYINGHTLRGNTALDQQDYAAAEEGYRKVIAIAPESFDGYWYMGVLYEQQERWSDALSWYRQALTHGKAWSGMIWGKIGGMLLKLEKYDVIEEELFKALRDDPDSPAIVNTLENLADTYYRVQKKLSAALLVYETIRQTIGESYEAIYQNLVGNAHYYFNDYTSAKDAFSRAVDANPRNPVFHSNLSDAWEHIRQPGNRLTELENAIASLKKALELDHTNNDYTSRVYNLEIEQKLVKQVGEAVLKQVPLSNVLEVSVATNLKSYLSDDPDSTKVSAPIQVLAEDMRKRLRQEMGLILPGINFLDDATLEENSYSLLFSGTPLSITRLPRGRRFAPYTAAELASLHIDAAENNDFAKGCWIAEADLPILEEHGLTPWPIMEYPLRHLDLILHNDPSILVDHLQITWLLETAKTPVAQKIKQSPEKRSSLIHVLKGLTHERVPVTAFDLICQTFFKQKEAGADLSAIVETLRSKPEIRQVLPGNSEQYSFYLLGPNFEAELARALYREDAQPSLALEFQTCEQLRREVWEGLSSHPDAALLVSKAELRPFVRKLIETNLPRVPVLSTRELLPRLKKKVIGKIELSIAVETTHEQAGTGQTAS